MENKKTNKISSEVNTLNYRLKQKQQTSMKKKNAKPKTNLLLLSISARARRGENNTTTHIQNQTSGANRRMKENLITTQKHTNTLEEQTNQKYAFTNTYTLEKQSSFNIIQTHTHTHTF